MGQHVKHKPFHIRDIITEESYAEFLNGPDFAGTPYWNYNRLGKASFKQFMLDHPTTEPVLLAICGLLGAAYVYAHFMRKQKEHAHWQKAYVDEKLDQAAPRIPIMPHLNPKELQQREAQEIDDLFEELFPGKYEIVTAQVGNKIRRKKYKPKLAPANSAAQKADTGFFKKIVEHPMMTPISYLWNTLGTYSYGYWVLVVILTMGHFTLGPVGMFTLPLIPLIAIRAYNTFAKPALLAKTDHELNADTKVVYTRYFLKKHLERTQTKLYYLQQQTDNVMRHMMRTMDDPDELNLPKFQNKRIQMRSIDPKTGKSIPIDYPEAEYIKQIRATAKRNTVKTIIGAVSAYIIFNSIAWPVTDFISVALGFSVGMPIVTPIAIVVAVLFGVNAYLNQKTENQKLQAQLDEINNNSELVKQINALEYHNQNAKKRISALQQQIDVLLKENNTLIKQMHRHPNSNCNNYPPLDNKIWNPKIDFPTATNNRFFDTLELKESKYTWFKKFLTRAVTFICGNGSGAFVVRSLLATGGVIALLFPVSSQVLIATVVCVGLVYGALQLYKYYSDRQFQKQEALLRDVNVRHQCLINEKTIVDRLEYKLSNNVTKLQHMKSLLENKKQELPTVESTSRLGFFKRMVNKNKHNKDPDIDVSFGSFYHPHKH